MHKDSIVPKGSYYYCYMLILYCYLTVLLYYIFIYSHTQSIIYLKTKYKSKKEKNKPHIIHSNRLRPEGISVFSLVIQTLSCIRLICQGAFDCGGSLTNSKMCILRTSFWVGIKVSGHNVLLIIFLIVYLYW